MVCYNGFAEKRRMGEQYMQSRHKGQLLQPPEGLGAAQIKLEKSVCTGEATLGFRDPRTGQLRKAVAVRTAQDIADFYHAYGYAFPPKEP